MKPRRIDPVKSAAHRAVAQAIAHGQLAPLGRCELCDGVATAYHHHSYLPRYHLDVVPVCDSCHTAIHHGRVAEPRTGRFRIFVAEWIRQAQREAGLR